MKTRRYLAVDVGGTKTAISVWQENCQAALEHSKGLSTAQPTRQGKRVWPTLTDGPEANVSRIAAEAGALLAELSLGLTDLLSIGISGGGSVDAERGVFVTIPNLAGWDEFPIAPRLAEVFGVEAGVENDANACALAERAYGAGEGADNMAFLTFSTGLGAGLIVDGRLLRGAGNLAGEVGHATIVAGGLPCGCGRRGCLEAYASGAGMAARLATARVDDPTLPATARDVVERAHAGDTFAQEFLRETARYLAMGLSQLIFCLNPQRIVLGTIAVGAGDLLLDPLRAFVAESVWPSLGRNLQIVPARLGEDLGDYAALTVARDAVG
jgi:glucokinase